MSDNPIEEKRPVDWERSVVIAVAVGVGVLLILAVAAIFVLALLGPAIGNVFTNVEMDGLILLRLGLGL